MTLLGWMFMLTSLASVFTLVGWCYYRILRRPPEDVAKPTKDFHSA